ncbi:MAG TPA: hypothetical protein VIJ59_04150 [Caulobacteraceae bacterium]
MNHRRFTTGAAVLAVLSAAGMALEPAAASAQGVPYAYDQSGAPPAQYPPAPPAPPAQYAPPAPYAPQQQPPNYNAWAYQQDYQNYRAQYGQWAAQNCVTKRSNNIAAGAIIGGVAGVLLAGSIAGWAARGAWLLFGGSLGLTAGAVVGASSSAPGCPDGFAVRTGAPPFTYGGPVYAPAPYYRPTPSGGWMWDGYRWVRAPYSYGYRPAPYAPGPY